MTIDLLMTLALPIGGVIMWAAGQSNRITVLDAKISAIDKLQDERHSELKNDLQEIKDLLHGRLTK